MEKQNRLTKRRLLGMGIAILFVLGIFGVQLFQIQMVEGGYYTEIANRKRTLRLGIPAARGEILDRSLRPFAINTVSYEIMIDYNFFPRGKSTEARAQQNAILLALTDLLTLSQEAWDETLPLTTTAPYEFLPEREKSVESLKTTLELAAYATAENCMAALTRRYLLDDYSAAEQRTLAGIQYEMERRQFGEYAPYTFASGVSKETTFRISEDSDIFLGVTVQNAPVREYVSHEIAAHLIGTVGPIYAEEYADLKEKGYQLNDTLGKSGVESAAEQYLRGIAGERILTKNSNNEVLEEEISRPPIPGSNVVLTMDMDLQELAQQSLDAEIKRLRGLSASTRNGHDVRSG